MKKLFLSICVISCGLLLLTGCGTETQSTNEKGESQKVFTISETAIVNNTKIKINSVKKIMKECLFEYSGKCQSYTEPDQDYFLLVDLTIENNGSEDLAISSLLSFSLKDSEGESGKYALLTKSITSQLDGNVMPNDKIKGQIAFDVKESESYSFYYEDSLLDSPIKFEIKKSDIIS